MVKLKNSIISAGFSNKEIFLKYPKIHLKLALFNHKRLEPKLPSVEWKKELRYEIKMRALEQEMLCKEISLIKPFMNDLPFTANDFIVWFEELMQTGPGQNDPLFDWLAETANREEMTWFIRQELASEAGFEDLTALTQIKMPTQPKLEFARNYWDEMGHGHKNGMHGLMLVSLAQELEILSPTTEEIMPEAAALSNIMIAMAINRAYAYHSAGALGAIELTAPSRAIKVYYGLKRLGLSPKAQGYYLLHSSMDIKHSEAWNTEVLLPLITANPSLIPLIAEGALLRLNAGKRCFERYRQELFKEN